MDFLLEVGTEELPASFVDSAMSQWLNIIPSSLQALRLTSEIIELFGTPRRLAVLIKNLGDRQPDYTEEIKGPPVGTAYLDNQPTKALFGFIKKQGVELDSVEIRNTDKGEFVYVTKTIFGLSTAELLPPVVLSWITKLEGKRFMRWSDGELRFPRPIRNLVALCDDTVLPIEIISGSDVISSDRFSLGHRVLHPEPILIPHAADYLSTLFDAKLMVNVGDRRLYIETELKAIATKLGGHIRIYPDLLQEVTNLVESPSIVVGKFDEEFLSLPAEVITTVMVKHQRYFPVFADETMTRLIPFFITISNSDPYKSDVVASGNERVIRARLADGRYFYRVDLAKPLVDYVPELERVTFQEQLGSVKDKVDRMIQVTEWIAIQLQLSADQQEQAKRAALLAKADLVTQMVGEFPELQGVMGKKYALRTESIEIADAIQEHYLPRNANDPLPKTLFGRVVGISDRLDTIVGIFRIGMLPTGSSDPFALRRAANAVVNIIWDGQLNINLVELIDQLTRPEETELINGLYDFFGQRIRMLLQEEQNIDYDLVNAVLGESDREFLGRALSDLMDLLVRARFLQSIRLNGKLAEIYETVNRSSRLSMVGTLGTKELDPSLLINCEIFQKSSEEELYKALIEILPKTRACIEQRNYEGLLESLYEVSPKVSTFFDGPDSVLVMDEDPLIRQNRLNLLGLLRNHARVLADFGAIVKT